MTLLKVQINLSRIFPNLSRFGKDSGSFTLAHSDYSDFSGQKREIFPNLSHPFGKDSGKISSLKNPLFIGYLIKKKEIFPIYPKVSRATSARTRGEIAKDLLKGILGANSILVFGRMNSAKQSGSVGSNDAVKTLLEKIMMETKESLLTRFDQIEIPPPVIKLFRDTREVAILDEYGRDSYRIGLDRLNTSGKLLGWILHLSEKDWVTTQHISELVELAASVHGIEVTYGM